MDKHTNSRHIAGLMHETDLGCDVVLHGVVGIEMGLGRDVGDHALVILPQNGGLVKLRGRERMMANDCNKRV